MQLWQEGKVGQQLEAPTRDRLSDFPDLSDSKQTNKQETETASKHKAPKPSRCERDTPQIDSIISLEDFFKEVWKGCVGVLTGSQHVFVLRRGKLAMGRLDFGQCLNPY